MRVEVEPGAEPGLSGVAPGQSVVLYDGTRVLGQATVSTTERITAADVGVAEDMTATGAKA
ncbi:aminomethyltransferase beta-barrel domain-containing protein [Pengzhenrongella sp.]|uniref:aminomethyltransferase beta-barrel domain-containing protein n=1 Tax=Pengzhenrongella sp. TaxID=2888820 RepID=UPI0039C91F50